jgi:hypothetical protein
MSSKTNLDKLKAAAEAGNIDMLYEVILLPKMLGNQSCQKLISLCFHI